MRSGALIPIARALSTPELAGDNTSTMTASRVTENDVLAAAARLAGLDAEGADVIRDGSNVMYRLSSGVVGRVGPEHTRETARRQVEVSRWLAVSGLPAVRALDDVPQPTMVGNSPVTWWILLPEHRPATTAELGSVLRSLHALAPPTHPTLPIFDPFVGLDERIVAARFVPDEDRAWLTHRVQELREQLDHCRLNQTHRVVHGDAWQGNVAVLQGASPVLLDLDHVSLGVPDWDLIPVAVDYVDFARLTDDEYRDFVASYGGRDATTTRTFRTLADIQELRWVIFVLGKVATNPEAAEETLHRIACLRGDIPRPWTWKAF